MAHCYAIEAAHAAAYLRITSAVEESGKTTLLEVLEQLLADRGINAVSISPAAVFRTREKVGPVALLLDEIDNTLRNRQDDGARDLLALVNAGYRRSATVIRTVGREHEARRFRAFGPAAMQSRARPVRRGRMPQPHLVRGPVPGPHPGQWLGRHPAHAPGLEPAQASGAPRAADLLVRRTVD